MTKILVFVPARMSSSRLPNKNAYDLAGKPVFAHAFERCLEYVPNPDYCFLAIPYYAVDDPLALLAKAYGYEVFRGSPEGLIRISEMIKYLNLGPEDIIITISPDAPCALYEHYPFIIEKIQELDYETFYPIAEKGTFLWGIRSGEWKVTKVKGWNKIAGTLWKFTILDEDSGWIDWTALKTLICTFPDEFQQPWPWEPLFLDYPAQAMQIKQVYDILYQGKPFDVRDVYRLLQERPLLANSTPKLPQTKSLGGAFPHGFRGLVLEELKSVGDYEMIEWDGKEGL